MTLYEFEIMITCVGVLACVAWGLFGALIARDYLKQKERERDNER